MINHKLKNYDISENFIGIGYNMFESDAFRTLSAAAISILLLFIHRYNGRNNGELHLTAREIRKWYGYGTSTAQAKLIELYEHGFIKPVKFGKFTTREGTTWRLTFRNNIGEQKTNDWKKYDKNQKKVPDLEPYSTLDRT